MLRPLVFCLMLSVACGGKTADAEVDAATETTTATGAMSGASGSSSSGTSATSGTATGGGSGTTGSTTTTGATSTSTGAAPQCHDLAEPQCTTDTGCVGLWGRPVLGPEDAPCVGPTEYLGCIEVERCGDETSETCDPRGQSYVIPGTCTLPGWTSCGPLNPAFPDCRA